MSLIELPNAILESTLGANTTLLGIASGNYAIIFQITKNENNDIPSIIPFQVYRDDTTWYGHGGAINELRALPTQFDQGVFLSASEDRSIRLWSIAAGGCVAIFGGGLSGHRDQVLSVDWHPQGSEFISSGVDGCVFIWKVPYKWPTSSIIGYPQFFASDPSGPQRVHQPKWSNSRRLRLHTSYIDCIRWVTPDRVISKSIDSELVLWEPLLGRQDPQRCIRTYQRLAYRNGKVWFTRFTVYKGGRQIVWGNDIGNIWQCQLALNGDKLEKLREQACGKETMELPVRWVMPIHFSTQSRLEYYLSVGQDGFLRLWF